MIDDSIDLYSEDARRIARETLASYPDEPGISRVLRAQAELVLQNKPQPHWPADYLKKHESVPMDRDDIIIAICNAPLNGMPNAVQKALVRIATTAVKMIFDGTNPPLDPPTMLSNFPMLNDVHLLGILLSRWGAEEEMKRRNAIHKGKIEP